LEFDEKMPGGESHRVFPAFETFLAGAGLPETADSLLCTLSRRSAMNKKTLRGVRRG
jgi:hypothetical protein